MVRIFKGQLMANAITLNGSELLTASAYDPNLLFYAPSLRYLLNGRFASSTVILNALINSKSSPVYENWSNSASFDPAIFPIKLNFTSDKGSSLLITSDGTLTDKKNDRRQDIKSTKR
jgi:hypothetical protein